MSAGDLVKQALLININKNTKTKTSLMLCQYIYAEFKEWCDRHGQTPSDVIDYLLLDFNQTIAKEIDKEKP